jgi:hypothetical protein
MKSIWTMLILFVLMRCPVVLAQEFKRFEFHVSGGLTASGDIPLDIVGDVRPYSIHVNNAQNVGAAFAVNLNELDAIELYWQRQLTEGRLPAELAALFSSESLSAFSLNVDQYHMNFIRHYKISVPKTKPYVMAALGATTYRANWYGQSDSLSYFSFSIGGGVKYYLNDHFGFRGEVRWSPTVVSASDSSFLCQVGGSGGACLVKLSKALQEQMDLTGGIFFRF